MEGCTTKVQARTAAKGLVIMADNGQGQEGDNVKKNTNDNTVQGCSPDKVQGASYVKGACSDAHADTSEDRGMMGELIRELATKVAKQLAETSGV